MVTITLWHLHQIYSNTGDVHVTFILVFSPLRQNYDKRKRKHVKEKQISNRLDMRIQKQLRHKTLSASVK